MAANCFSSAVSTAYSTTTITTPFIGTTSVTVTSNVLVTSTQVVTNLLGLPSTSTVVGRTAS